GLCQQASWDSLADLVREYNLKRENLYQVPERIVARRIVLDKLVDGGLKERAERYINRAVDQDGANLLILHLNCHGGDSAVAYDLAQFLIRLGDRKEPVQTIAYVDEGAGDTAAFLAFACNRIVLHPKAQLKFDDYVRLHPNLEGAVRDNLKAVAARQFY